MEGFSLALFFGLVVAMPAVSGADKDSCAFSKINRVVKDGSQHKRLVAETEIQCIVASCNCNVRCVVSYHSTSNLCLSLSLTAVPLAWTNACGFLSANSDSAWVTYVSGHPEASLDRPSALWLMDDLCRGRNLGSKGGQLDCASAGIAWTGSGPLHGALSDRRFARLGSTSIWPRVQVRHGSSYVIDFSRAFTIAMWVKTDNVHLRMPLVEAHNAARNIFATHFWFYSSYAQNQLYIFHTSRAFSHVNSSGRLGWRHVIITTNGVRNKFYLNGTVWPIGSPQSGVLPSVNGETLLIGRRENSNSELFKGFVACVAIFQREVTDAEAGKIMNMCG